jgi:hypothetical protein
MTVSKIFHTESGFALDEQKRFQIFFSRNDLVVQFFKVPIVVHYSVNYSVKNHWTKTKFRRDLSIPLTNLHKQYQPYTYMYIQTKVGEWILKISYFF